MFERQSLHETVDFILYLFDKEQEDKVYEQWLHAYSEMTWTDYRKKYYRSIRDNLKKKTFTQKSQKEMIQERLARSSQRIKFTNFQGEEVNLHG